MYALNIHNTINNTICKTNKHNRMVELCISEKNDLTTI